MREAADRFHRLVFDSGSSELPPDAAPELKQLAQAVRRDDRRILVIAAFAGTAKDDRAAMRRLSIERVLRVRAALMDAGLSSLRIDPRACGYRELEAPPDRVDIFVVEAPPSRPGPCGPRPADEDGLDLDAPVTIPI